MGFVKNFFMQETLDAYCGSHIGNRRTKNEDNYYLDGLSLAEGKNGTKSVVHKTRTADGSLSYYAVFDGMGGGDYGEIASFTVAEAVREYLAGIKSSGSSAYITNLLEALCDSLNKQVHQAGVNLGAYQMGTTIVSMLFCKDQAWLCNIGDSKGFLFRNRKLQQLSKDHVITSDRYHKKPALSQFLGVDSSKLRIEPYICETGFQLGDIFLLCSDGLTDMVPEKEIASILSKAEFGEAKVQDLINAALKYGGEDNITVMLIEIL